MAYIPNDLTNVKTTMRQLNEANEAYDAKDLRRHMASLERNELKWNFIAKMFMFTSWN